jgi:pimeloyl-ACP methyl ester carboxylesterase
VTVSDRRGEVGEVELFWREAPVPEGRLPTVYVHGVPGNSDDFLDFVPRSGGFALDLPGFGRSAKPAHFPYSIEGYSGILETFLDDRGVERCSLVMHDWGTAALGLAQRAPERFDRLVIMDGVPLLPGFTWHRAARIWRTPLGGELFMGLGSRRGYKRLASDGYAAPGPPPDELVDSVWDHFDHGTQRAILKLYRTASPSVLAVAGEQLREIDCPALIVWGADDPYVPSSFANAYAEALGGETRVEVLEGVRHWPWVDDPRVIDRVLEFLDA